MDQSSQEVPKRQRWTNCKSQPEIYTTISSSVTWQCQVRQYSKKEAASSSHRTWRTRAKSELGLTLWFAAGRDVNSWVWSVPKEHVLKVWSESWHYCEVEESLGGGAHWRKPNHWELVFDYSAFPAARREQLTQPRFSHDVLPCNRPENNTANLWHFQKPLMLRAKVNLTSF